MKNSGFKAVAILALALWPSVAWAQVWRYSMNADKHSIVRTVDSVRTLVYTSGEHQESQFVLQDRDLGEVLTITLPAALGVIVRDFRVDEGGFMAYFCGTCSIYGGSAVFGEFKINSVFPDGGPVRFYVCDWLTCSTVMPTDLKRMKLFTDGGVTCLAMAGESMFGPNHPYASTTVVSAYPAATGTGWEIACFANKEKNMHITDVAVLDDMVVAVGSDTLGEGCYFKPFFRSREFPRHPAEQDVMYRVNSVAGVGEVLAERLDTRLLVLAQYNNGNGGATTEVHRVALGAAGAPSPLAKTRRYASSPPVGTGWRLLELLTNSRKETYLLHRADCTGTGDYCWLFRYDLPMSSSPIPLPMWRMSVGTDWHTMDFERERRYPLLSGKEMTSLLVGPPVRLMESTNCYRYYEESASAVGSPITSHYIRDGALIEFIPRVTFFLNVSRESRTELCREEQ